MTELPVDRMHPPRAIRYRLGDHAFTLRPWGFDDLLAHIDILRASLKELRAFMAFSHHPLTLESQFNVIKRFQASYWEGTEYVFGVFAEDGTPRGGLGLHPRTPLNPSALEVGYWCGTPYAGNGLTTATVRCAIALGFDWLGCDRVQVLHDTANVASQRVVEKCGFRSEGVMRNAIAPVPLLFREQGYAGTDDAILYGLCREDLASLAWLPEVRGAMTIVDVLGRERSGLSCSLP